MNISALTNTGCNDANKINAIFEDIKDEINALTPHNLLSAKHGDTLTAAVSAGDIIIGNNTPKWSRYGIVVPSAGTCNYLGVNNAETVPTWKSATSTPGAAATILQTDATGLLNFTGAQLQVADPTYPLDAVNLHTLQSALPSSLEWYLSNDASADVGGYKLLDTDNDAAQSSIVVDGTADGQALDEWVTVAGSPGAITISEGEIAIHFYAKVARVASNDFLYQIQAQVYKRSAAGVETQINLSVNSLPVLTIASTLYSSHLHVTEPIDLAAGDRLVLKLLTVRTGDPPRVTSQAVTLYIGGATPSHISLPTTLAILENYVPYVGATKAVDLGANNLTTTGKMFVNHIGEATASHKVVFDDNVTIASSKQLIVPATEAASYDGLFLANSTGTIYGGLQSLNNVAGNYLYFANSRYLTKNTGWADTTGGTLAGGMFLVLGNTFNFSSFAIGSTTPVERMSVNTSGYAGFNVVGAVQESPIQYGNRDSNDVVDSPPPIMNLIGSNVNTVSERMLRLMRKGHVTGTIQVNATADFNLYSWGPGGAGDSYRGRAKLDINLKNDTSGYDWTETADETILSLYSDGRVTLPTDGAVLGFGVDSDVTLTHVHNVGLTLNENFTMTTAKWLGLGAAKGKITFTDAATDTITFDSCDVGIGTTPNIGGVQKALTVSAGTTGDAIVKLELQGSHTEATIFSGVDFYHQANLVSQIAIYRSADDAAGMVLYTKATGVAIAERLRITTTGNVGVDYTAPTRLFCVGGDHDNPMLAICRSTIDFSANQNTAFGSNDGEAGTISCFQNTTGGLYITGYSKAAANSVNMVYTASSENDFTTYASHLFRTYKHDGAGALTAHGATAKIFSILNNTSDLVTLLGNGNFGVGTTAPVSLTEIQGGLTTTGAVLTLGTKETTVVVNDVLGRINFYAPLEADGSDAILVGASIVAIAEDTFTTTVNKTSLLFQTGASEVATTKMALTSAGYLGVNTTAPECLVHLYGGAHGGVIAADPSALLCIEDDTDCTLQFLTPNDHQNRIYFGDQDTGSQGRIIYDHSTDFLTLYAVGNDLFTMGGGNLNVGLFGVSTFDGTANKCLAIKNCGAEPAAHTDDQIYIYSVHVTDGAGTSASLGLYAENSVKEYSGNITHELRCKINGSEYGILLTNYPA